MVTIAIKEGKTEKAKEIGKRFPDNGPIQSQMVTIAIKEGELEKAKEIGERFPDDALIVNYNFKMYKNVRKLSI